jgi:hypothetical protein
MQCGSGKIGIGHTLKLSFPVLWDDRLAVGIEYKVVNVVEQEDENRISLPTILAVDGTSKKM